MPEGVAGHRRAFTDPAWRHRLCPKEESMRLQPRVEWPLALSSALLSLLVLSGCVKTEADDLARTRAEVAKADSASARIKLKSLVQAHPKSGEARYLLGARLLADGDAAAAVLELQRALDLKHPAALVLPTMADALVLSGQAQRAVLLGADAVLPDPDAQARLQAAVAHALAVLGNLPGANAAVARALAAAPTSAPALLMKARLAAMADDPAGALATLDQLLVAHPDNAEAWALKGDFLLRQPDGRKAAMVAYQKALQIKPDQVYSMSALVALHIAQGHLDAARTQFTALKKVAPKQINTGFLEAHLAYAAGHHAQAREIYQVLLRVLPENINLLLSAGENELKLNAPVAAEALFAKAAALSPRNPLARRLLAQAQLRLGQAAKALVTLGPLLDPPDSSADVLALAAQARLVNGQAKEADALYTRLAKLKPTDPQLRTLVASARFGRIDDDTVFSELQSIASDDQGSSADLALIGAHLRRGQLDAGLAALAALQRKRPTDPMPQHLRGQVLAMKQDTAGARKSFDAALALDAGYFPSIAALAALDLRDNQPDMAQQRFKTLLKTQPKNAAAMLALAELLVRQHAPRADVQKQIMAAVQAAPADPDARVALIAHHFDGRDFDAALNAALAATVALPDNIDMLALLARCQMRVGQTHQAVTAYGKIVSLQPRSARGHVGMADVYLQTNELDLAQRSISRALELSPGLPEAQAQAVLLALRRNRPDAALAVARSVQAERPTETTGLMMEGEVEMRRSNWSAAAAAYRKAVDKLPTTASAGKLYSALVLGGKAADAEQFGNGWLRAHPTDGSLLYLMGSLAQSRGDGATAVRRYRQLLALQPDNAAALNNLAMQLIAEHQPGAVALAERAVQAAPTLPAMLDTLAQAQAQDNNLGAAVAAQRKAVALAPEAADFRFSLAQLLIRAGEKAQARAELERLAKLGPGYAQRAEVLRLNQSLGQGLNGR